MGIIRIKEDLSNLTNYQDGIDKELNELKNNRVKNREALLAKIKVNRNTTIIIVTFIAFVGSMMFVTIVDSEMFVCIGIAIIIIGVLLFLIYKNNFRDITGKLRLEKFDRETEILESPLIKKNKIYKENIISKKTELEKHIKIVEGQV